mgnify:CR=1 FL=1
MPLQPPFVTHLALLAEQSFGKRKVAYIAPSHRVQSATIRPARWCNGTPFVRAVAPASSPTLIAIHLQWNDEARQFGTLNTHTISIELSCVEKLAEEFVGFLRVCGDMPGDPP